MFGWWLAILVARKLGLIFSWRDCSNFIWKLVFGFTSYGSGFNYGKTLLNAPTLSDILRVSSGIKLRPTPSTLSLTDDALTTTACFLKFLALNSALSLFSLALILAFAASSLCYCCIWKSSSYAVSYFKVSALSDNLSKSSGAFVDLTTLLVALC